MLEDTLGFRTPETFPVTPQAWRGWPGLRVLCLCLSVSERENRKSREFVCVQYVCVFMCTFMHVCLRARHSVRLCVCLAGWVSGWAQHCTFSPQVSPLLSLSVAETAGS